jgi:hypothetical protein
MRGDVNLTAELRGIKLRLAMTFIAVAILFVIVLAELAAPTPWWFALGLPLFGASLQLAQAFTGVCIFHARNGTRACPGGAEQILDPRKRACVRTRGHAVLAIATGISASSTLLVVVLAAVR